MITVEYKGTEYPFGFTRQSAAAAENAGFNPAEIDTKPNTMIPILVYYAASTYNRGIKRKLVDEIYDEIQDKAGFLTALGEEYAAPVEALLADKEQGNATWRRD